MSDLLKESIADAKAVRETAIANAKSFLEENFAKSMKEMFADKLREDSESEESMDSMDSTDSMEEETKIEEKLASSNIGSQTGNVVSSQRPVQPSTAANKTHTQTGNQEFDATMEEGIEITSEELDEILAELESDSSAYNVSEQDDVSIEESEESEMQNEDDQSEINLDELLAELDDDSMMEPSEPSQEDLSAHSTPEAPMDPMDSTETGEIPSPSEGESYEQYTNEDITSEDIAEALIALSEENESLKKQLIEANRGLRYVKTVLEESNILNAKLLYTNKLFKNKNLTEDQKLKVINTFDLTKTLREIKLAYTVLAESFNAGGSVAKKKTSANATVSTITEGLASKPVTSTKPGSTIVEPQADMMALRFQKLAGIKK